MRARTAVGTKVSKMSFDATRRLECFVSAYIDCALWSTPNERYRRADSDDADPDDDAEFLDNSAYELSDAAREKMTADCRNFMADHGGLLTAAEAAADAHGFTYDVEQAGHDFWLTRNGHGCGFWDRDLGPVGDQLSAAAKSCGERNLHVGDDDMIHVY